MKSSAGRSLCVRPISALIARETKAITRNTASRSVNTPASLPYKKTPACAGETGEGWNYCYCSEEPISSVCRSRSRPPHPRRRRALFRPCCQQSARNPLPHRPRRQSPHRSDCYSGSTRTRLTRRTAQSTQTVTKASASSLLPPVLDEHTLLPARAVPEGSCLEESWGYLMRWRPKARANCRRQTTVHEAKGISC